MPRVDVTIGTRKRGRGNGFRQLARQIDTFSARNAYNFARSVESGSKRRAHVITGFLRDSIYRERLGYGKHRVVVGAPYGVYEEYGTRYRPPHPYFRPAVEVAKAEFLANMRKVFRNG